MGSRLIYRSRRRRLVNTHSQPGAPGVNTELLPHPCAALPNGRANGGGEARRRDRQASSLVVMFACVFYGIWICECFAVTGGWSALRWCVGRAPEVLYRGLLFAGELQPSVTGGDEVDLYRGDRSFDLLPSLLLQFLYYGQPSEKLEGNPERKGLFL